jgi:hypothetical protein
MQTLRLRAISMFEARFLLMSLLATLFYSLITGEVSVLFSFVVLYFAGSYLMNKIAPEAKKLLVYSFCLNVLFAVILTGLFELEHGSPFIKGMLDDERFFKIARDYKNGLLIFDEGLHWGGINFKAYTILLAGWLKLLNLFGFSSDHFLNLNILNCLLGAFAVAFVYLIFCRISNPVEANKIAWIVMLYPPVIYYSATLIRDTAVTLVFLASIWILLLQRNLFFKLFLLSLSVFVLYHIRDASAFFLVIFISSYLALSVKQSNRMVIKTILLSGVILLFLIFVTALSVKPPDRLPPRTELLSHLSFRIHYYQTVTSDESSENSLGAKLKSSQNPLLLGLSVAHMFFSPAPPLLFYDFSVSNLFLGLGNIIWYFFGFCYLVTLKTRFQDNVRMRLWWAALTTTFVALILINFTSGNFRHLNFIQPLLIGIVMDYLFRHKREIPTILITILFSGLSLIATYVLLKIIF